VGSEDIPRGDLSHGYFFAENEYLTDLSNQIDSIVLQTEQKIVGATVNSLRNAAKLNEKDAKTCVYWRLGTNYLEDLDFYPALALVGASGSGKNTIMTALQLMPGKCSDLLDCSAITMAVTRDILAMHVNRTFFADEFDEARPEVEKLFMARTTRSMSIQMFKQLTGPGKYEQKAAGIFGASVLHKRALIADPAISSRTIQIFTRHEDGPYSKFIPDSAGLESLKFDMSGVITHGGRIETTWSPVLEIARQLQDTSYIEEITATLAIETRILRQKAEYDPASVILAQLIEVLLSRKTLNRWFRIDIEYEIGRIIRADYPSIAPITVNSILNNLGFLTNRSGGRRWLYPDIDTIKRAAERCNYEDDTLNQLDKEFQVGF
jgi:hypothetical protein